MSFFVDTHVSLEVRCPIDRIIRDNEQGSNLDVTLRGPWFRRLQELEEFLEKRFQCASGIQDFVQPLPQITVSIPFVFSHCGIEEPTDALLEFVVKFRTKLHIALRTPGKSLELLQTAIRQNYVGIAKLVVAIEPLQISKNSCFCPATVVAKVMKCASAFEVVTLLLEICRDPLFDHRNLFKTTFDGCHFRYSGMERPCLDLVLKHIGTLAQFGLPDAIREMYDPNMWYGSDISKTLPGLWNYDPMKWYGSDISKSYHKIQTLPGLWNLTAEVHGLLLHTLRATCMDVISLREQSRRGEFNTQVLKLQVTLQTAVTGACSMAIGVRNVQVRIQNASLDSSASNLLGFFLSHITVSIRPEVEQQQVLLMLLDVPSPNEPYDISATRTKALSASVTGSKNPGGTVTATESSSDTIKSTTTDWRYEHTRGDEFTGNVSWTLRRLAGVPFDYAQPKCTKVSARMSILKRRPVTSMLEPPFNSDGSVTFSEQCPKTIQWILAHELEGTDVAWYVSVTVHVTMLDRSTGEGKTLEFWSPHHFLHNMSTDVECTPS